MVYSEPMLTEVLRKNFGFAEFRHGQLEAITSLLNHGNLLCIHPTGFGKSLLYQLPAILLGGITVVISPLLALMRDQQEQLHKRFNIPAASINTDQSEEENNWARSQAMKGDLRILFVAPEQLDNIDSFQFLLKLPISLIVVDEAHCISTWGHDFRPSYRQILTFIRAVQNSRQQVRILGLTATADRKTEDDIRSQLTGVNSPLKVLRESMNRPNISLSVFGVRKTANKLHACWQFVQQLEGCGLIYCSTRENTELVAAFLKHKGINAAAYHAGMDASIKRNLQKDFVNDRFKVIAATNALGMGIDKANLRFIIHFDIPGSITAYYQEVGRCGRDGQKANGVILFDPEDTRVQEYFIESSQPSTEDFTKVIDAIGKAPSAPTLMGVKSVTGLHPTRVTTILAELIEQGYIRKVKENNLQIYVATGKKDRPDLSRYTTQFTVKMRELKLMLKYAGEPQICLMEFLRKALGDSTTHPCGHCAVCCVPTLAYAEDLAEVSAIQGWMDAQTVEIGGYKTQGLSIGQALLDGKQRSPLFVSFMRQRSERGLGDFGLPDALLSLLKLQVNKLMKSQRFAAIVPIPSRTWSARNEIASMLGKYLGIPVLLHLLRWNEVPEARQGFLLNNDQRLKNVQGKMGIDDRYKMPTGHILLLDDYIGSGATFKEAARALRKEAKFTYDIVPLAIAAVKWKLGSPGMI